MRNSISKQLVGAHCRAHGLWTIAELKHFSGCSCSSSDAGIYMGAWPGLTQLPLEFFFMWLIPCTPYILHIRLREIQDSRTSGSQGLFGCVSADGKWKQNGRLSNSSCFVGFLGFFFHMRLGWAEVGIPACTVFSVNYAGVERFGF